LILVSEKSGWRRARLLVGLELFMPLWLILIIVGVVLAVVGFGGVGQLLIWIGVIVLVVGAVLALVGRSRV